MTCRLLTCKSRAIGATDAVNRDQTTGIQGKGTENGSTLRCECFQHCEAPLPRPRPTFGLRDTRFSERDVTLLLWLSDGEAVLSSTALDRVLGAHGSTTVRQSWERTRGGEELAAAKGRVQITDLCLLCRFRELCPARDFASDVKLKSVRILFVLILTFSPISKPRRERLKSAMRKWQCYDALLTPLVRFLPSVSRRRGQHKTAHRSIDSR